MPDYDPGMEALVTEMLRFWRPTSTPRPWAMSSICCSSDHPGGPLDGKTPGRQPRAQPEDGLHVRLTIRRDSALRSASSTPRLGTPS